MTAAIFTQPEPEFVRVTEAMAVLRLGRTKLYELIRSGRLPSVTESPPHSHRRHPGIQDPAEERSREKPMTRKKNDDGGLYWTRSVNVGAAKSPSDTARTASASLGKRVTWTRPRHSKSSRNFSAKSKTACRPPPVRTPSRIPYGISSSTDCTDALSPPSRS